MGSGRDRDDPLSFTSNPSTASSPVTVSDYLDTFLGEPTSRSGSFQSESLLGGGGGESINDADFGFARPDFRSEQLAGTVQFYERHVFLCYKKPSVWPARIEAAEFDRLPRLLSAAVSARKSSMKKETRLTICEGHDGTETSNGDVLIFPDMIRYRRLTHFDVDTFVEEVLVKDGEWLPGNPELLKGSYVFVCSHGSRDRRCGVCGPSLVSRFREELEFHGLQGSVSISPCSHIGGHKYAGNVIIYRSNINREVTGHWYGYVTPEDVPILLEQHINKGEIVDRLWRGEMGLSEEDQKKTQEGRFQLNGAVHTAKINGKVSQESSVDSADVSCCQQNGSSSSCCQDDTTLMLSLKTSEDNQLESENNTEKLTPGRKIAEKTFFRINSDKGSSTRKVCGIPTWLESWEREDTYAALAVVCAAASVVVAYTCYKQL
ncbi:Thioredoxin-like ferredoxin [Arabidopsis thaliana x Arabidopsis arenosa]|uniref:Thioredoxin-like ferredoxin n=1 Tax=Arabidopsis thaliana x Arabidopsis arenosa TaxID=1240361 RepID=A0A8T1Y9Q3_9BRAS|nr:Thioredoxin-like ferredoxin [Arabidopsis thaliana x Arabidopsis arenosa]